MVLLTVDKAVAWDCLVVTKLSCLVDPITALINYVFTITKAIIYNL